MATSSLLWIVTSISLLIVHCVSCVEEHSSVGFPGRLCPGSQRGRHSSKRTTILIIFQPPGRVSNSTSSIRFLIRKIPHPRGLSFLPAIVCSRLGGVLCPIPMPSSRTATWSLDSSIVKLTLTLALGFILFPCSIALVHASATAVFKSSIRSAGKWIIFPTEAAKSTTTFSKPSTLGIWRSKLFSDPIELGSSVYFHVTSLPPFILPAPPQ